MDENLPGRHGFHGVGLPPQVPHGLFLPGEAPLVPAGQHWLLVALGVRHERAVGAKVPDPGDGETVLHGPSHVGRSGVGPAEGDGSARGAEDLHLAVDGQRRVHGVRGAGGGGQHAHYGVGLGGRDVQDVEPGCGAGLSVGPAPLL